MRGWIGWCTAWAVLWMASTAGGQAHASATSGGVSPEPSAAMSGAFQDKLTAPDAFEGDAFGSAVAVSGDTALVGAPGAAYVYVRRGNEWALQQQLLAEDPGPVFEFGTSVALCGDTALVGASKTGLGKGAAYVFVRSGETWLQQQVLRPPEGGYDFGHAVDLSEDTAVVAGRFHVYKAVYVFGRDGDAWAPQGKVGPEGELPSAFSLFSSVSVSGDTILAGVDKWQLGGVVHVFVRSGGLWVQQTTLAFDHDQPGCFGSSVALLGDTALVGAAGDDYTGGANAGSVFVYRRTGTVWEQQAVLRPSDPGPAELFGWSVALSEERAVVGAAFADEAGLEDRGAAYVFTRSGDEWFEEDKLLAPNAAGADRLGHSVALSGSTVIAGALYGDAPGGIDQGAAYVFDLQPTPWAEHGHALAGGAGVPLLKGVGSLRPDTPLTLSLSEASPLARASLVIGIREALEPFKGGVLVPEMRLVVPIFTDGSGEVTIVGRCPAGLPSGFTVLFQSWIHDPAGPMGYSASNAISATVP